ncbi:NAD(P)/FAD-dependent oxidoreductase [Spirosoma daeguense]
MSNAKNKQDYDAVVVGSGPNGLSAAITLQLAGLSVLLLEAKDSIGGGLRSAQLTLPDFVHDVCSAIHPMAVGSPFFQKLPLAEHGLDFIDPPVLAAHPFDDGTAAALLKSLSDTANALGTDAQTYRDLLEPLTRSWPGMAPDVLGPLRIPKHPIDMALFGLNALLPSTQLLKRFTTKEARGLLGGMAAHSIQPLTNLTTSAIAMVLTAAGHLYGWPIPKGGSQSIANALASYFRSLGGKIETDTYVRSMKDIPASRVVLFDITPKQLLRIAGDQLSSVYRKQLSRYRYGMGVFKVDWALSEPIPFTAPECRQAGTVHIGGTFEEIVAAEKATSDGQHPEKPFALLAQQSLFDPSRAPKGKHTAWAYCHVPNGSTLGRTKVIEQQIERFAPGFRDCILARHTMDSAQMETYNPNYIGGDINGGILDISQLYTRPTISLSPYKTSASNIFICSSSTPPGGGVHGMCGYHAARVALRDAFGLTVPI